MNARFLQVINVLTFWHKLYFEFIKQGVVYCINSLYPQTVIKHMYNFVLYLIFYKDRCKASIIDYEIFTSAITISISQDFIHGNEYLESSSQHYTELDILRYLINHGRSTDHIS